MSDAARLRSTEAIRDFRAHLIDYIDEAQAALGQAGSDVVRTLGWLKHDRMGFWRAEIRRRKRDVELARNEMFRKKLESSDMRTSAVIERKNLKRAEHRLAEAEQKEKATIRWIRHIERESALFKAGCNQMSSALQADLPKAVALLEKLSEHVEAYIRLKPKSGAAPVVRREDDGDETAGDDV